MHPFDKISDQTGYLILTNDGGVLASGGDLENNETISGIIFNLISLCDR